MGSAFISPSTSNPASSSTDIYTEHGFGAPVMTSVLFLSPAGKPDTPGAAPAPAVSVHAPADLGQGCATPATDDTLTSSKTMVVNTYFFLWCVLVLMLVRVLMFGGQLLRGCAFLCFGR